MDNLSKRLLLGCSAAALSLIGGNEAKAACELADCSGYTNSTSDADCACGYVSCPYDSSKILCPPLRSCDNACSEVGLSEEVPDGYTDCDIVYVDCVSADDCGYTTCYDTSKCTPETVTCEDKGYKSSKPSSGYTCTTVSVSGLSCYDCTKITCATGGYKSSKLSGYDCTAVTYQGLTCYRCTAVQSESEDTGGYWCNCDTNCMRLCEDRGYYSDYCQSECCGTCYQLIFAINNVTISHILYKHYYYKK